MTLIEMVRETKKQGHRYITVDKNGEAFSSNCIPIVNINKGCWVSKYPEIYNKFNRLCDVAPYLNWKKSLIDITKLTLKG